MFAKKIELRLHQIKVVDIFASEGVKIIFLCYQILVYFCVGFMVSFRNFFDDLTDAMYANLYF